MGRRKPNKPGSGFGSKSLEPAALEALELFPMDPADAPNDPEATDKAIIITGMDPAVLALARLHRIAGRQAFFIAAFDKGLNVDQAERLEGLILFKQKLAEKIVTPEEREMIDRG